MELNNIKLPASLVVDLYHNSLVETDDQQAKLQPTSTVTEKPEAERPWNFLGSNRKNVLILVDYKDVAHLPQHELNFLTNMLAACKLTIEDVAILNINDQREVSYKNLIGHFKTNKVFLFAVEPTVLELPLSFPHFQVQAFASASFLFVPTLKELEEDQVLKSKLWVCLRRIFGI